MELIGLVWRTVRHLTFRQIIYQVIHRLRGRDRLKLPELMPTAYFLPALDADKPVSWQNGNWFTFLHQSVHFSSQIDWNYDQFGKLWTYYLTYFDFLIQPNMKPETGLALIHDFINQIDSIQDGLEAYPSSLRITNWVHFLSRYHIKDERVNQYLFAQVGLLCRRVEYHLGGNHLLENGFALLIASLYFRQQNWLHQATRLIQQELISQILGDGGHYERSPTYHQILLDRMLNTILILQSNDWINDPNFVEFLIEKAAQMLMWLSNITFRNDDVPMVNDATADMAPPTTQLNRKAESLLCRNPKTPAILGASGYRMFRQKRYEFVADIGQIGPDHQPGHAHADTLSFVLYVDNQPVVVDNGVSTYQIGARRTWERSTIAHNTVTVEDANSSEVWASFRVGRRARVVVLTDSEMELRANHDGYRKLGILHERTWTCESDRLVIKDRLLNASTKAESDRSGISRFYFHPTINLNSTDDCIEAGPVRIKLTSATKPKVNVATYSLAKSFNQLEPSQCMEVTFVGNLEIALIFTE